MKKVIVSERDRAAIQRLIKETDWNAFWAEVTRKTAPQIDAYHKASARSSGVRHVFLAD